MLEVENIPCRNHSGLHFSEWAENLETISQLVTGSPTKMYLCPSRHPLIFCKSKGPVLWEDHPLVGTKLCISQSFGPKTWEHVIICLCRSVSICDDIRRRSSDEI